MSSISILDNHPIPTVFYTAKAWNTIQHLVAAVPTEIGWWQMVEKMSDGNYLLTETIVPEQTVSGGEADITKDSLAEEGDALLAAGHDTSKLLCWGHSHVNMAPNPSGQDVSQALAWAGDIPFIIRGIYNKKGEARVDILDFEKGIQFNEVPNMIYSPGLDDAEKARLDALIESNVKTRTYATGYHANNYGNSGNRPNGGARRTGIDGYWRGAMWVPYGSLNDIVTARRPFEEPLTGSAASNKAIHAGQQMAILNDPDYENFYDGIDWPGAV